MPDDRVTELAAAYDAHADERERAGEPEWRSPIRAAFAARLAPGARLVELGAGVGYTAQWFAGEGFAVTAIDLSAGNVAKCREKGVAAEVGDITALRLPHASFDAAWAASCLMHVADVDLPAALHGIRDVLVPGGLFWAGTWGGIDREGTWDDDWYEPKRFYSLRSHDRMQAMYEAAGFTVLEFAALDVSVHDVDWAYQSCLMAR